MKTILFWTCKTAGSLHGANLSSIPKFATYALGRDGALRHGVVGAYGCSPPSRPRRPPRARRGELQSGTKRGRQAARTTPRRLGRNGETKTKMRKRRRCQSAPSPPAPVSVPFSRRPREPRGPQDGGATASAPPSQPIRIGTEAHRR